MISRLLILTIHILLVFTLPCMSATLADSPPHTSLVLITATPGGSVYPDGAIRVTEGSSLIITITPDPGYRISTIFVNDTAVQPARAIRVTPVRDVTVHAEFTEGTSPDPIPAAPSSSPMRSDTSAGNASQLKEERKPGYISPRENRIIVGPEKADYKTIQEAVEHASPGDSIVIRPGMYKEQVTIPVPISLSGESGEERPVIYADSGNIITIQSDNVILNNITLSGSTNAGRNTSAGVFLGGASDIVISNCLITGSAYGIYLNISENTTISNCTISNESEAGIFITDLNRAVLEKNSINHCQAGILGEKLSNISIQENLVGDNTENGLVFSDIFQADLSGNIFSANAPSGFTPWESRRGGVSITQAEKITLSDNILTGNGGTALLLDDAILIRMSNNTLTGNYAGFTYRGTLPDPHNVIDRTNTVDGLPVFYGEGLIRQKIEGDTLATLYLQSCSDMTIENVTVLSRNGYGIMIQGGINVTITRCRVGENLHQNIILASLEKGVVSDSDIDNGSRYGIGLLHAHNVTVSGNRIRNQQVGIAVRGGSTDPEIINNSFSGNGIGFQIGEADFSSGTAIFEGNNISRGRTGIVSLSDAGVAITGNTITDTCTGMNLSGASGHVITGNLINATQNGVFLSQGTGSLPRAESKPCTGNTLTRNTIHAGTRPVAISGTGQQVFGNTFFLNDFIIRKISAETCNDTEIPDTSLTWGGVSESATGTVKIRPAVLKRLANLWDTGNQSRYRYGNNSFTGNLGNHWIPYSGKEIRNTGIGDLSHWIDDENSDRYPLIAPHAGFQSREDGYLLDLQKGWNFISIPSVLAEGKDRASIFTGVDTAGHSVYTYTNNTWILVASDDRVLPMYGYWIYAATQTAIPLVFDPGTIPSPVHLNQGWNAIGSPAIQPEYVDEALSSLDRVWSYLVPYNTTEQQYEKSIIREETGGMMYPSRGYWLYADQEWDLQPVTG